MVGMSSLNVNNPMVDIMEQEFELVRKLLLKYTKLHVRSLIIINICNVVLCLTGLINIPLLIVIEIMVNLFLIKTLRDIHKECNLNKVGKIYFGSSYDVIDVNISDVYNTTRTLCKMKGKLESSIYIIEFINKMYIIAASINVVWATLFVIFVPMLFK